MSDVTPLRCDCHGRTRMAELDSKGRIIIERRSHGKIHRVVIDPKRIRDDNSIKKS